MKNRSPGRRLTAQAWLFVIGTVAVSLAADTEPQSQPDPFQLFQRMMPAIRHPRCTNCHGGVDPFTGDNHHGGVVPRDNKCTFTCHTDAEEWQIPGNEHFFAGRTDRQICSQIADFVSTFGREPFRLEHIRKDDQILQAFEGFAGGAREPGKVYPDGTVGPAAEKPLMTHEQLVQAGDDWILQGNGACDLAGTITVDEWVNSVDTVVNTPSHTHIITQTATRKATITAEGARFRADITTQGEAVTLSTQRLKTEKGPCTVILTIKDVFSGNTQGPAKVVMKDTAFMIPAPQPPATDYRIDIELPPEKTQRNQSTVIDDGCTGLLTDQNGDTQTDEFDEWAFTLEGRVMDGRENAIGGCTKAVKWDEVGKTLPMAVAPCNRFGNMGNAQEPWLVNHGALSAFHDGSPIPFHINVTWNLRRR
jgi:hypothetical protein